MSVLLLSSISSSCNLSNQIVSANVSNLTKFEVVDYEINFIKIEGVDYETSGISVVRLLTLIFGRKA